MRVIHEGLIKFILIFFIFNIFIFNASAEIVAKLKFPLDNSKTYEFHQEPTASCSNQPPESDDTVCFTNIQDYKLLCKKTRTVTKLSAAMNAMSKPGGMVLYENGGFKSVEVSWNDQRQKCTTVMEFGGMVRGTDLYFEIKGYITKFNLTKEGKFFGTSYPE